MPRLTTAVLLIIVACEPGSPEVVVRFQPPSSPADAVRVELSLLPTCAGQPLGDAAVEALTTLDLTPARSRPLGTFDQGDYGLYARAFDASCVVIAAGCTPVTVGDGELLAVLVAPVMGPGCDPGERCGAEGTCAVSRAAADAVIRDGGG